MRRMLPLLLALFIAGCAKEPPKIPKLVPDEVIPSVVRQRAEEQFPHAKITKVYKNWRGNYEVNVKDNRGKLNDLEVTPDGKVLETG